MVEECSVNDYSLLVSETILKRETKIGPDCKEAKRFDLLQRLNL